MLLKYHLQNKAPSQTFPISMHWKDLLFFNFSISPDIIQQHLPAGMQADTYNGMAYISLVPMTLQHFKVRGLPRIFKNHFYECNVRTYVKVDNTPGVYFFSLDANSLLEVCGAKWIFNLKYRYRRMRFLLHQHTYTFSLYSVFLRKPQIQIHAQIGTAIKHTDALLQFCTSRDRYFVLKRKRLWVGHITHEPWTFNAVTQYKLQTQYFEPSFTPAQVFYSKGLEVQAGFLKPAIRPVIFYDGACGFCNRAIRILLSLDKNQNLYVAPLGGNTFKTLYTKNFVPDRIMFYDARGFSDGARALLQIVNYLPWYYVPFKIFNFIPKAVLNAIYDRIAKHRYFCERPKSILQSNRVLE